MSNEDEWDELMGSVGKRDSDIADLERLIHWVFEKRPWETESPVSDYYETFDKIVHETAVNTIDGLTELGETYIVCREGLITLTDTPEHREMLALCREALTHLILNQMALSPSPPNRGQVFPTEEEDWEFPDDYEWFFLDGEEW